MRSRSEAPHDLIVVGGGVIGLACARAAAQRGLDVLLLERDHEARGASWAAAGLVAPQHTVDGPDALFELLLASRALYPGFVEELGPHDTGWRTNGRLAVAPDVGEAERLRELVRWQRDRGLRAEWIEPAHVRDLEPAVTAALSGGAFFPDDADIDARRLLAGLRAAAEESGVRVRTGVEVTEVTVTGDQVHGVASRERALPGRRGAARRGRLERADRTRIPAASSAAEGADVRGRVLRAGSPGDPGLRAAGPAS